MTQRFNLFKNDCALRDDRWSISVLWEDDGPCSVRVKHRKYGDYYDWPEAAFAPAALAACLRAYDMQEEISYHTRSSALKAAKSFLRRFGAGDVEYLEHDSDSHQMIVVGHSKRAHFHWPESKPCQLEALIEANLEPE